MDLLKLDVESVSEMKAFYLEELSKAIRRIDHINKVLEQLGESGAKLELRIGDGVSTPSQPKKSSQRRKYKKKRGPKSKWDKVIIKSLKQAGKPLTYDELTNYLMISEGRDPSKRSATKATVQNTVFRLRNEKKLRTFSLGSRIKYIAPSDWFDGEEIKQEFRSKVSIEKKKEIKKPLSKRGPGRPPSKKGPGRPPKKRGPGRPRKAQSVKATSVEVKKSATGTPVAEKPKSTKTKAAPKKKPSPRKAPPVKAATVDVKKSATETPIAEKPKSTKTKAAPKKKPSPRKKAPAKSAKASKKTSSSKTKKSAAIQKPKAEKSAKVSPTKRKVLIKKTVK